MTNSDKALATPVPGAVSNAMVERREAEERVMQDYRWGNLTPLGVANHLRRAGFNLEYATAKANALEAAVQSPPIVWIGERDLQFLQVGSYREAKVFNYEDDHRVPLSSPAPVEAVATEPVAVCYTNWRGETAIREIRPLYIWFGATEWHPEPQWLITAVDIGKGVERDFALTGLGHPTGDSGALREALVETRKCLTLIIDDGIPMDWQAWRDDIDAALSPARTEPDLSKGGEE